MEISYSAMKARDGWYPVVILGTERYADLTALWKEEEQAIKAAKLMSERLICSLRTQLKANHFHQFRGGQ
jgi:hypothetical protein